MPTAVIDLPLRTDPPRKRWTRAEYERLSSDELGDLRLELVEGDLISKMGQSRRHVIALVLLQECLAQIFGPHFVQHGAPIDVAPEDNPSNEPEPDIIVTCRDMFQFPNSNPRPEDVALVVEVADSTLGFDLKTKARLYARAGISDYWVVDVSGRRIIVHRDPVGGEYGSVQGYTEDESVSPLAALTRHLTVREVFPG